MTQYDWRNKIVDILYRRRHETMANLAFELKVSRQTIQNDITALSIEHPEIEIRSGRYGGGIFINAKHAYGNRYLVPCEKELLQRLRVSAWVTVDDERILANLIYRFSRSA